LKVIVMEQRDIENIIRGISHLVVDYISIKT
jgi:hypothetical protein